MILVAHEYALNCHNQVIDFLYLFSQKSGVILAIGVLSCSGDVFGKLKYFL